jgi:hypothetical protein
MECLPVSRIPEGDEWIYKILCGIESYVARGMRIGNGTTMPVSEAT